MAITARYKLTSVESKDLFARTSVATQVLGSVLELTEASVPSREMAAPIGERFNEKVFPEMVRSIDSEYPEYAPPWTAAALPENVLFWRDTGPLSRVVATAPPASCEVLLLKVFLLKEV
jgi:hypothetical protein